MSRLLTPYEVGAVFGVGEQTVNRWARRRLLRYVDTSGGRRFREEDVLALWRMRIELEGHDATAEDPQTIPPGAATTAHAPVPGRP